MDPPALDPTWRESYITNPIQDSRAASGKEESGEQKAESRSSVKTHVRRPFAADAAAERRVPMPELDFFELSQTYQDRQMHAFIAFEATRTGREKEPTLVSSELK